MRKKIDLKNTIKHWKHIACEIREPLNDTEYEKLAQIQDCLLDTIGENESHELIGLVDFISQMLERYEERKHYQVKGVSGIAALKFLMEQHHLKQSDLPEIGSQGVVSEILQGKRKLNLNQIKRLSQKFHVSPETFF